MAPIRTPWIVVIALIALPGCTEQPRTAGGDLLADVAGDAATALEAGSDANATDGVSSDGLTPDASDWPSTFTPPTEATVLDNLVASHPRLVVLPADLARIKSYLATDAVAQGYLAALTKKGDKLLTEPVAERVLVGPRLLAVSREVMDRIYTLALLYRINGETKYLDRARQELLGVAQFKDWNPSHFLDVAEMTHAFAIGYDWLYHDLSAADRATIRQAIVDKGLKPAKQAYEDKAWWTVSEFNWNNVCNGGILVGALAVGDEEPALASYLAYRAVVNLPKALASYAPDGAWAEGPGYWGYATRYSVVAFAALKSALGTDFGLSSHPGLDVAGLFRIGVAGPTKLFFNYADCGEKAGSDASLFWLGRRYGRVLYAWAERTAAGTSGSHRDLIWYDERGTQADLLKESPDRHFLGPEVVVFRASWDDPSATYVAFKGGDNAANHSHLDLGTFVLDALGQRWAIELGPDDYNLPEYFGSLRWTYYRLATVGQNTLLMADTNQDTKATAPITVFVASTTQSYAVTDLTAAYAPLGAKRVWRGVALLADRKRVLVVDEIEATKVTDLVWGMHTKATVALSGTTATLAQDGKQLSLELLSGGGSFSVSAVDLAPPRKPTTGVNKLKVQLKTQTSGVLRVAVLVIPDGASTAPVTVRPLADWKAQGPTQ